MRWVGLPTYSSAVVRPALTSTCCSWRAVRRVSAGREASDGSIQLVHMVSSTLPIVVIRLAGNPRNGGYEGWLIGVSCIRFMM